MIKELTAEIKNVKPALQQTPCYVQPGDDKVLIAALQNLRHNDVIIVDAENIKEQLPFPKSEPFILHNPYPPELKNVYEGMQFVCKGKHQYREVKVKEELNEGTFIKVSWVCQCGRKL